MFNELVNLIPAEQNKFGQLVIEGKLPIVSGPECRDDAPHQSFRVKLLIRRIYARVEGSQVLLDLRLGRRE